MTDGVNPVRFHGYMSMADSLTIDPAARARGLWPSLLSVGRAQMDADRIRSSWVESRVFPTMPSADHTTYNIDDRMRRQLINEGWTPPPPSHSKQAADERIINEIARNDPTVHAFMKIKRERGMSWDDIMVSLVAHLAAEKRDLQTALRVTMQEQNVASVASAIMREQHTALRPAQNTQAPNWYDDH